MVSFVIGYIIGVLTTTIGFQMLVRDGKVVIVNGELVRKQKTK